MTKYRQIGKRITALALTLAMVLAMSSADIGAIAATLGGIGTASKDSIASGGYIAEIVENTTSTNQKVDSASFSIATEAGRSYSYEASVYQHPDEDDPTTGVKRIDRKITGEVTATEAKTNQEIDVTINGGDDGKPIILTPGERLSVVVRIIATASRIHFNETDASSTDARGYSSDNALSWQGTGDIIAVKTSDYTEALTDFTASLNPDTTFFTLGDSASVNLGIAISPKYKRTVYINSDNTNAVKVNNNTYTTGDTDITVSAGSSSGKSVISLRAGNVSGESKAEKTFYTIENILSTTEVEYAGDATPKPTVTVECGDALAEGTDYSLTYNNATVPGTASVTITGKGDYAGYSKTLEYTINKGQITEEMVNTMVADGGFAIDTSTNEVTAAALGDLNMNTDFTATATNPRANGTEEVKYTLTVTGIGNYEGSVTKEVTVTADSSTRLDINRIVSVASTVDSNGNATSMFEYTGSTVQPEVKFYNSSGEVIGTYSSSEKTGLGSNVSVVYGGDANASDTAKTVTITGTGNYKGTITLEYWVQPYDISPIDSVDITIGQGTGAGGAWIHTGDDIQPSVTVALNGSALIQDTDYSVTYANNKDIGVATVTIRGMGNFTGTVTRTFEIIGDFVSDTTVSVHGNTASVNSQGIFATAYKTTYDGTEKKPKINPIKIGRGSTAITLVEGTDYEITDYKNNVNAGTATITVEGRGKYAGASNVLKVTYTIEPKSLSGSVSVAQGTYTYTGNNIEPACTVAGLTEGTDYTLSYVNNINAGTASVTATGTGNYTGTITGSFTIAARSINDEGISVGQIVDRAYNGRAQTLSDGDVVITYNGAVVSNANYTISGYSNNTNVGTASVTITGRNNLKDSRTVNFTITPKTLQGLDYTIEGNACTKESEGSYTSTYKAIYTGDRVKPTIAVYDGGNKLEEGTDYTVSYYDNIAVGEAYAQVKGKGTYAAVGSTARVSFAIDYRSFDDVVITDSGAEDKARDDGKVYPKITVVDPTISSSASGGKTLVEDVDYVISVTDDSKSAGENKVATITGKGGYQGAVKTVTYTIGTDLASKIGENSGTLFALYPPDNKENTAYATQASVTATVPYIGEQHPYVRVLYNGNMLTPDTHYTLDYEVVSGNGEYNAGSTVRVTATGAGTEYYGTKSMQYTITPIDLSKVTLADGNTVSNKTADWTYTYGRKAIDVKPTLTYTIEGGVAVTSLTLTRGTDYTLDKSTVGPAVGTDTVTISAVANGNFTGSLTRDYTINKCDISRDTINIEDIATQYYTGIQIKPTVTIKHTLSDGTTATLTKDTDYEIAYGENKEVGDDTGSVTITGIGNYTGSKTVKFKIDKRDISEEGVVKFSKIADMDYDGTPQEPKDFSVTYQGNLLKKDTDYTVTYAHNTLFGKGDSKHNGPEIIIEGQGKYTGTAYCPFTIKANLADKSLFTVTGLNEEKKYTIENGDIDIGSYKVTYDGGKELPEGYYKLNKPSTMMPGDRDLTITGVGDICYGTQTVPVKLVGKMEDTDISNVSEIYDYTGKDISISPIVMYNGVALTKDTDYTVTTSGTIQAVGTGTITFTGTGNYYTGSKTVKYDIKYNLAKATVTGVNSSYNYTGSKITTPGVVVTIGDATLAPSTDYTIEYGANTNVSDGGQVIIKATGDNTVEGSSKTVTFTIKPKSLKQDEATATFNGSPYAYTGNLHEPEYHDNFITVRCDGKELVRNTDYILSYDTADDRKVGEYTVTIRGIGNYTDTRTVGYQIKPGTITAGMITVSDVYYAGGEELTPSYSVTYNGRTLTKGTDYEVSFLGNRRNVTPDNVDETNKPKIIITGNGNYTGTVTKNFVVRQADLSLGVVEISQTSSEYTGKALTIDELKAGESGVVATIATGNESKPTYTLVEGKDYSIKIVGSTTELLNAGNYTIRVTGKGNFINSIDKTYTITPRSIEASNSNIDITYKENNDYTGEAVTPTVKIKDKIRRDATGAYITVTLVEGTDYTLLYTNNVDAASKDGANAPGIRIEGLGNYTGTVDKTFNIGSDISGVTSALSQYSYAYDAAVHTPTVTAKDGTTDLTEGVDYTLTYADADGGALSADAGTKSAIIVGMGKYYGTKTMEYSVEPKVANRILIVPNLSKDVLDQYYATYTGDYIEPTVEVYDTAVSTTVPVDPSNYDVKYSHNKDMSTATNPALINITFKNNYAKGSDSYVQPFIIKAKTIEAGFDAYLPAGSQYSYTGSAVEPEVVVKPTTVDVAEGSLVENVDYKLTYLNNISAGPAVVTVTGIGNYSGDIDLAYNIVADLSTARITAEDQFYTGQPVYAPLTVVCGGNTLTEGVDYNVVYTSNDNYSESAVATITPANAYYSGSASKSYDIDFDASLLSVTGYRDKYTYTGRSIRPSFVITTPSGDELWYDASEVEYTNSNTGEGDTTSVGVITAKIPVTVAEKTCVVTVQYEIVPLDIADSLYEVKRISDNVYTGGKITPPVIITDKSTNRQLAEGVDYTLSYSNNINPGTATVRITGKGDFEGTSRSETFRIIAPNVLGLTGTPIDDSSIKLSWLKNAHITGYEVYSGDGKKRLGTTDANSYTITGLTSGEDYTYRVRTYIKVGATTTYGAWQEVTAHTSVGAASITGTSYARNRATINWTGSTNVTGYEIYRSTTANGTFKKIAVMPATAGGYSDSGLKSGTIYYYKVRAYEKVGENQFDYGYFSDVIPVSVR